MPGPSKLEKVVDPGSAPLGSTTIIVDLSISKAKKRKVEEL